MKQFRIKVCGVTRLEDALKAEALGADLIGMIFYRKSPRCISLKAAASICRELSPLTRRVGVFVDESRDRITEIARRLALDFVQLHGEETAGDIAHYQKLGLRVIKAFPISRRRDYDKVMSSRADLRLVDNRTEQMAGGTGRRFDWSVRPGKSIDRLVIAGGIDVANVAEAVRIFRPVLVDVNSGVESSPGKKSKSKLTRFFKKCDELRYGSQETDLK